jgi:serine/threonine protein kinase/formylglycine-generating enzyme required for sulfatase activity/dienelactone hydrolase
MPEQAQSLTSLVGLEFSHYRIIEEIGSGGMGVVYRARDSHLEREVAIKVLTPGTITDETARKHLRKEALALSQLNHPNIATVYDFDTQRGVDFLVMEFIPGITLSEKLPTGPLPEKEVLRLGMQLAEGLAAAHEHGVVHRDLKPGNLRLTSDGRLKILDFGLAKLRQPFAETAATEDSLQSHSISGTLQYMAPEQLSGEGVDTRTDIHAAGFVLYEMATGQRPFAEVSSGQLIGALLRKAPTPPRELNHKVSAELERIIGKCVEKDPENRYQSARELAIDLRRLVAPSADTQQVRPSELEREKRESDSSNFVALQTWRKPIIVIPMLVVISVLLFLAGSAIRQNHKARWAREVALPQAQEFIAKDDWASAYGVAVEAEKYIPGDPQLKEVFADTSILISVKTDPPGANAFLKPYASESDNWEFIGRTPIEARRISRGFKEYKITEDGYDLVTGFSGADQRLPPQTGVQILLERSLAKSGTTPAGMVRVDGGKYKPTIIYFRPLAEVDLEAFLIDRFETSNSQYQAFVDAGGYRDKKYWKQDFVDKGRALSWDEAVARFTDKTGRNGPSTWELGHFPEGQADYPVSGISWYEAAAYAEFAGKSLPTVYHWNKAAGVYDAGKTQNSSMIEPIIRNSNFAGSSTAPAGKFHGISPYGAYDMAGNVREWIWNGAPGGRYLLGGSWGVPEYLFFESGELLSPFDRSATNGFRCVKLLGNRPLPTVAIADVPPERPASNFAFPKPVSDEIFKIYASYYSYDKGPLNAVADPPDDSSPNYVRQRVTFNAAYGGERVVAYLFFPKNTKPPFQTVLIFPGSGAFLLKSIDEYASINVTMFTRSGRAVVWPIYKGTFERPRVNRSTPALERDYTIMLYKDLARTMDYMETRPEFDREKVAYFGLSWGGEVAPIIGALEKRIKLFVLEGAGLDVGTLPEIAPANFAPRLKAPTVIFNGRYDLIFPIETSAKPLLELLGTPKQKKTMILFDGGHVPPLDSKLKKEMLDCLDAYLGPVS